MRLLTTEMNTMMSKLFNILNGFKWIMSESGCVQVFFIRNGSKDAWVVSEP